MGELVDGAALVDVRRNSGDIRRRHTSCDGRTTWIPDYPDSIPLTAVESSTARYSAYRAGHERDRLLVIRLARIERSRPKRPHSVDELRQRGITCQADLVE